MTTLIIGGQHGIGQALAEQLVDQAHTVIKTSRHYQQLTQVDASTWTVQCDLNDSTSMQQLAQQLQTQFTGIDWLINCAGVLHTENYRPEKSLKQVNQAQLLDSYTTNAIGHLMLIQTLEPLICQPEKALVTSISARIGSIEDNHLGGWHAYRMSKAALNMGIKCVSIEWRRTHPQVNFLLLHPGTTDTALSKPFQKNLPTGQLQTTTVTAQRLIKQMLQNQDHTAPHALFIDYQGLGIPW